MAVRCIRRATNSTRPTWTRCAPSPSNACARPHGAWPNCSTTPWARPRPDLRRSTPMRPDVAPFHDPATGTWTYVVSDPATRAAAIIDPVLDFDAKSARTAHASTQKLLDNVQANTLDVQWLLETHAHADHLSDAQWLLERFPRATLGIGSGIVQTQRSFAPVFGFGDDVAQDGSQFGRLFEAGATFTIGELQAEVIGAPGH